MFLWNDNLYAYEYELVGMAALCRRCGIVATREFQFVSPSGLPSGRKPEFFCADHAPFNKQPYRGDTPWSDTFEIRQEARAKGDDRCTCKPGGPGLVEVVPNCRVHKENR